ncbi:MAG: pitrilysin family protein [Candidatus Omnitrophica bacterium]|nr:pitrilysin family protein [Candidatus Omnitrophota bacterium]
MYRKATLDNGLRIISHHMPGRQSLALGIWINVGGRYEGFGNKGIAHFLEHLLFKGTKKYSCRRIKESIEGVGGSLNGFTSDELTCYMTKIPAGYLELALDILSDMVINPALPEDEVEKEKQVILEEIKMYKDLPQSYVHELLDELLWPDQPVGAPIIGTVESVSGIGRKELDLFRQKYYTASNIIISAAGSLKYTQLLNAAQKRSKLLKKQEKNSFQGALEKQDAPRLKIFHKDTEQTHMAMGFHALKREHPLKHALGMLHIILGANMSSRLFHELREKRGLAYEIGTTIKRLQDTGSFIVHAGIDNRNVEETVRLILAELKKASLDLVTSDEFKRAREFYLGQLMLALEDTMDHMLWIGESAASLDTAYSLQQITKEVRKVKREDIRQAARQIFRQERLNMALIGPLKESEQSIYNQLRIN